MGFKVPPDPRRAEKGFGKLRRYKCRNPECGRGFRDPPLPGKDRFCEACKRKMYKEKKGE